MFCRSHISFDSSLFSESPFPIHQDSESSVLMSSSHSFSAFLLLISLLSFCFTDISQLSAFLFLTRPFKVAKNPLLLAFALSSSSHSLLINTCFHFFFFFFLSASFRQSLHILLFVFHPKLAATTSSMSSSLATRRLCCCCLKWRGRDAHEVNSKTLP